VCTPWTPMLNTAIHTARAADRQRQSLLLHCRIMNILVRAARSLAGTNVLRRYSRALN